MSRAETGITLCFVLLALVLWQSTGFFVGSVALQLGALALIGVIAPTQIIRRRRSSS